VPHGAVGLFYALISDLMQGKAAPNLRSGLYFSLLFVRYSNKLHTSLQELAQCFSFQKSLKDGELLGALVLQVVPAKANF